MAFFAPGFFEYEQEPGGDLLVTVLRAVGQLSMDNLPTRPGHAGWPMATPLAQCLGPDALDFAFALGGNWESPAGLYRSWEDLFLPIRATWFRDWNGREHLGAGVQLDGEGLALSAIMPARQGRGIVVRCLNLLNQPSDGRLHFGFPVSSAERIRADETLIADLTAALTGSSLAFTAQPGELVSLRVSGS
jgi:alpha-mannosidase